MSSGTFIIQSAYQRIGAHSVVAPATPEAIEAGQFILNSMMQLWLSENIDLGTVPLLAPGSELGEPADSTNAIIDNLALLLAPNFDNGRQIVSPQLKANAKLGKSLIRNLYQQITIPEKVVSSTLPLGQGGRHGFRWRTFKGVGNTVDG